MSNYLYQIFCIDIYFKLYFQPHEKILFDSENVTNGERQVLVVISTPGLNDWAKEKYAPNIFSSVAGTSKSKRSFESDEPMDCSEPNLKKGKVQSNDSSDVNNDISNINNDYSVPSQSTNNTSNSKPPMVSKEHILNFPIPNANGKSCIVKVTKIRFFNIII